MLADFILNDSVPNDKAIALRYLIIFITRLVTAGVINLAEIAVAIAEVERIANQGND